MFKMPEQFDMPEEANWSPPVEYFRKFRNPKKQREGNKDYVDTAALPYDDPWYCDPEIENKCPQPCDPDKFWCELPCDCPIDEDGKQPKFCNMCPDPDKENDTLPAYLRLCFQIVAMFFEFHVVFIAILPWWLMGIGLIMSDLIYDWVWYGIFFAWCKPCAWIFIWLLNIPQLLLHIPYYWQRLQLELVGAIFDGWTLIIGGDGCFARWGQDCWFAKRMKERDHMSWLDLVWLTTTQPAQRPSIFMDDPKDMNLLQKMGFPGTFDQFSKTMDGRQIQAKAMAGEDGRVQSSMTSIFGKASDLIKEYNDSFFGNLATVGFWDY